MTHLKLIPPDPAPTQRIVCRPIPERRSVVRFKSGHVLRIDHEHILLVMAAKAKRMETES